MGKKTNIFIRLSKHTLFSLFGTATDTLVLWLLTHFLLNGYVAEYIIAPIISFEAGNAVNYIVNIHMVWPDRMKGKSRLSKFKHYLAFNLSYSTVFLLKTGILLAVEAIFGWDVVICNIIALIIAGFANFIINDKIIFRKKKQPSF